MVLVLLASCSKEEISAIISGRILKDCTGEPLGNFNMVFSIEYPDGLSSKVEFVPFSTDKNGYFSFTNTHSGSGEIGVANGHDLLRSFPVKKNIDLGTFYATPTTSFVYRIKVNNPYQVGDTLRIYIPGFQAIKIPAPIHDSVFSPILNYSSLATQTYPIDGTVPVDVGYDVYKGLNNTVNNRLIIEEFTHNLPECNNLDTITIEIN